MFARWGYFVYRRRVPVLALSLLLLALSGIALASGGELRTSGLSGAESTRAGRPRPRRVGASRSASCSAALRCASSTHVSVWP